MHLFKLLRPLELEQALAEGLVRRQLHPTLPYVIYNYTEKAQFQKSWSRVTLACRGLIVNHRTGEVLARPFPKFFNYEEVVHRIDGNLRHDEVVVTDKMDGSLGIMYPAAGKPAIATRGSFASDQALHATLKLEEKYPDFRPPAGKTLLFEIVYPQNRIVVDYGDQDDLVLLGMVDIKTGTTYGPQAVPDWPGPRAEVFPYRTLQEALSAAPRFNAEGLVVHFVDRDVRVKLKQEDYVRLHKIVFGLNERVVWELVRRQKLAGDAVFPEILEGIPEEFHPWVNQVADRLLTQWWDMDLTVGSRFEELQMDKLNLGPRKDFALAIKDEPAWLRSCLFLALDGRDYGDLIWKQLDPGAAGTPFNGKEAAA